MLGEPIEGGPIEEVLVTRGTEIDQTATVGMPTFVRTFEHLRWQAMQDPRLGLVDLIHDGHFFVVRTQVVELRRRIGLGVALRMRTTFESVGRSTATVRHEATRVSDGAIVARARVVGVWLGPTRRMARLPDQCRAFSEAYTLAYPLTPAEGSAPAGDAMRVPGTGHPRSFTHPPEVVFPPIGLADDPPALTDPAIVSRAFDYVHRVVVPPRDLDVFSHVNAATWALYCDDARHLGAASIDPNQAPRGWVVRAGLFYGREAVVGDALDIGVWSIAPRALGFVCLRGDEPLVTVRFDLAPGARAVTEPSAGEP